MASYQAIVKWEKAEGELFTDNRYSRGHRWIFDEDVIVAASSSPHIVPLPMSVAAAVDPEEALVAALSSCHMLFFLSFAAQGNFVVNSYHDEAVGVMGKGADGKMQMLSVTLSPILSFEGDPPTSEDIAVLHHKAHEACFLANSVKFPVEVGQ